MTRVDFYVVADNAEKSRWNVACRLAEKAYGLGQTLHIHTADKHQATQLDSLLWTYRDGSFVPHAVVGDPIYSTHASSVPIVIGAGEEPAPTTEILLNLCDEVPSFFSRMDRVLEIVGGDEQTRSAARVRFKFYRDRGYDLNSYNL